MNCGLTWIMKDFLKVVASAKNALKILRGQLHVGSIPTAGTN